MRSTSGSPDLFHHRQDTLAPGAGVKIGVDAEHLVDLPPDRHHRIERRHRLLKNHRHGRSAQLPQPAVAGGEKFFADQFDAAADGTSEPFCNRPITVSDVTDFPDPLSPTRHSVSPSRTCRETPSMMRLVARVLAEADHEVVDIEDDIGHR